jgi:hypothetical protein
MGVGYAEVAVGQESTSFLKKRSKKLLFCCGVCHRRRYTLDLTEVFWFFFSKKNGLLFSKGFFYADRGLSLPDV